MKGVKGVCALFLLLSFVACGEGPPAQAPTTTAAPAPVEGNVPSFDGVPIHYKSIGRGDAAVVLVHCWSCNLHNWDGQIAALTKRYRVVAIDLAGHGASGKERKEWTVASFGQDVRAVVVALDLKRVVLVGHSMGGPVILEATNLMPERVVGLVPVDTLHDAERDMPEDKKQEVFTRMRQDFSGTTHELLAGFFPKNADKALVDKIAGEVAAADPAIAIPALENLWHYDERTALGRVKAPIRAINADLFPTSLEHNRKYAPQFDVVVMKGVGHWLMRERPDEFNAKLLDVIDGMRLAN
jgi:sigma-B regulation protein RsbQ